MFFDPLWLLIMIPSLVLSAIATGWVQSAFSKYSKVRSANGLTGAEAARMVLDRNGLHDVPIEEVGGTLSDHYDPRKRVLRLSSPVYRTPSIAAIGVAAHEAGHALQHSTGYAPLMLRQAIAPAAAFGSKLAWLLIIGGMLLNMVGLMKIGVLAFAIAVFFTLVTLPVEFNASRRAKAMIRDYGIVTEAESAAAAKVLNAAAMTYVAAAITAILQLLYFLIRSGLLGGRRD
jgi:Zn-dependent membrane protease YugP